MENLDDVERRYDDVLMGRATMEEGALFMLRRKLMQLYQKEAMMKYQVEPGTLVEYGCDTYTVTKVVPNGRAKPSVWGMGENTNTEIFLSSNWRHLE